MPILDILLDVLVDSLVVFAISFVIYFVLSFFTTKLNQLLLKKPERGPIIGAFLGIIPECSTSVIGANLFNKRQITLGTLVAIFLACSDEAIPMLLASNKWYMTFVLILIKFIIGFIVGIIIDLIIKNKVEEIIESDEEDHDSKIKEHLIHPLIDSLKVFAYVFVISFIFELIIYYIGEDNFNNFMSSNHYLSPILASIIALIPNCFPSVLLTELYINNTISFGAMLAGLMANCGIGFIYLFKKKSNLKLSFIILGLILIISIAIGYAFIWL